MEHEEDEDYGTNNENVDLDDLESRVSDLETATASQVSYHPGGLGCGGAVYSLGATLSVVISWESNHAVLWAALHGFLSWLYVIYVLVAHSERVKLL
jgi:hypothetical protein